MSMLLMLKEGGSLGIDSIGLPIDEDIDLLPDANAFDYNLQFMLWIDNGQELQYLNVDALLLVGL